MFQREVAERIVAKPGSEHYGRLSVLAGWRTRAKIQFDVNRNAFVHTAVRHFFDCAPGAAGRSRWRRRD